MSVETKQRRTRTRLARHPLILFTVLAYVISWLCWLPLLAARQGWVGWSVSPYLQLLGGLGPAAAALITAAVVAGRTGVLHILRQVIAWRGRLRWLALAVLGPLALFAAAVIVARAVEGTWPDLSHFGASTEYPALPLVAFWAASLIFDGFGEEIGWRGFAQPTLAGRHSALGAAMVVSAIWAAWHIPLFGVTPTYRAMPAIGFLGFFLSIVTASLVLAWLYLHSRASILVAAVFHTVFDVATTTPTTTTLIPTLMGAIITVAGLAVIPNLYRRRSAAASG
ncbi:MAG TPA: CPBP family intramembrane glutamic endopeptidase [Micrococcaceae bacterium]|jgi:membrane protease YdiL (CAAX protease family)|nr:CPBP family intramembrane glutamic endopeptidase [Micrococcaceae bacterium]